MAKSTKSKRAVKKPPTAKSASSKSPVASASPKSGRKKKMHGPFNRALVERYASDLKMLLGEGAFEDTFRRLKDDKEVQQAEATAIASVLLDARVPDSTARGTALGRILKLHNSLLTFKLKQRAVGGRSAA